MRLPAGTQQVRRQVSRRSRLMERGGGREWIGDGVEQHLAVERDAQVATHARQVQRLQPPRSTGEAIAALDEGAPGSGSRRSGKRTGSSRAIGARCARRVDDDGRLVQDRPALAAAPRRARPASCRARTSTCTPPKAASEDRHRGVMAAAAIQIHCKRAHARKSSIRLSTWPAQPQAAVHRMPAPCSLSSIMAPTGHRAAAAARLRLGRRRHRWYRPQAGQRDQQTRQRTVSTSVRAATARAARAASAFSASGGSE